MAHELPFMGKERSSTAVIQLGPWFISRLENCKLMPEMQKLHENIVCNSFPEISLYNYYKSVNMFNILNGTLH